METENVLSISSSLVSLFRRNIFLSPALWRLFILSDDMASFRLLFSFAAFFPRHFAKIQEIWYREFPIGDHNNKNWQT